MNHANHDVTQAEDLGTRYFMHEHGDRENEGITIEQADFWNFWNCNVGFDLSLNQVMQNIRGKTTLKTIDLCYCDIGDAGVTALVDAFQMNFSVKTLDLFTNQIGDCGAALLSHLLKTNRSLQRLSIEYTLIGYEGIEALAQSLISNNTLTLLNLCGNRLSDLEMRCLSGALRKNRTLEELYLGHNLIESQGACFLADALGACDTSPVHVLNDGQGDRGKRRKMRVQQASKNLNAIERCASNLSIVIELTLKAQQQ